MDAALEKVSLVELEAVEAVLVALVVWGSLVVGGVLIVLVVHIVD